MMALIGPSLLATGLWLLQEQALFWAGASMAAGSIAVLRTLLVITQSAGPKAAHTPTAWHRHTPPPAPPRQALALPHAHTQRSPEGPVQTAAPRAKVDPDDAQDTRLVTLPDGAQRPVLCTQRVWDAYDALVERTQEAARALPEQANDLAERDGISFEDAFAHLVMGAHQTFAASS